MNRRILHFSNTKYPGLADAGYTKRIWEELGRNAEEYRIVARGHSFRPRVEREGHLFLHLWPSLPTAALPGAAYGLLPLVRRHRIDAIVCQDPVLGGVAATHVGRLLRVPVLVEIHTDLYFRPPTDARSRTLGALFRHALEQATAVRIPTEGMGRRLRDAGINARAIVHVPYRVDLRLFTREGARPKAGRDRLGLGDARPLITSVGRFVPQKGYVDLLDALRRLSDRLPQAELLLVGGGRLAGRYRERVAELGLEGRVHLVSNLPQRELVDLLAATDVYCQPSMPLLGEAMPRTLLEAMAMELPIVATEAAFLPDVIDDRRNGLLVPPGRPDRLAEAIVELASDRALAARLGHAALDDARRHYEWDTAFDTYRSVLYSLRRDSGSWPQTASRKSGATTSG
jgi:glycosyltransferase involved in cell wall biosynthesis